MAVTEEEDSVPSSPSSSSSSSWPVSGRRFGFDSSASPSYSSYLSKTVLRSSVVLHLLRGHIRSPSSNDVVLGKETSIELVIIDEDGTMQSVCEQPVFGTIKDMAILPWNDRFQARSPKITGKDILIVVSDSGKLSFLTFSSEMHRFLPLTHIELGLTGNSRDQIGRKLAVDSNGCFIAASAYEDKLALLSVSTSGSEMIDKKILLPLENERKEKHPNISGTIWSMCFISQDLRQHNKDCNPILAVILNRRLSLYRNELLLLKWNLREHTVETIFRYDEAGPLAHHIVEVPYSFGFAFLFRGGDAILMDFRDAQNPIVVYRTSLDFTPSSEEEQNYMDETGTIRIPDIIDEDGMYSVAASALLELSDRHDSDPMAIDAENCVKPGPNYVCSWSWEPRNVDGISRMIFSADSGDLFLFEISFESDVVKVNMSDSLYKGLPSNALLWVEGGFVAVIVEMGDGMVLKLEEGLLRYQSPIQNIAPILDMSIVDHQDEKHDQIFACCGMSPEGSLRIIQSGISMDRLLKTAPIYQGITGTWAIKMKRSDSYHSFLVLSFVEETRVLSVGVSFSDVTDSVGFQPNVCTLACGLVADGLLVQIHRDAVRLCVPNRICHPEAISLSSPSHLEWYPESTSISLGAVGHNFIVVATSSPCFLFILGIRSSSSVHGYEIFQMQQVSLQNELSCISIPVTNLEHESWLEYGIDGLPAGMKIENMIIVGTHKPSVEILSFCPELGLQNLVIGAIALTNSSGTIISGCVPQDVRLVLVGRPYLLSGLRNGMVLRFEWPPPIPVAEPDIMTSSFGISALATVPSPTYRSSSVSSLSNLWEDKNRRPLQLQLIAVRRIGITPAFLVPLNDSLHADIIALSDRPWLLHSARHSLSFTSISFEPPTHATAVRSVDCPNGILFVAESSLHLVEMVPSKRLNVQKFHLGGTPRKVLYHSESRLLVILRTDLQNESHSSDVCCVDPLSGSIVASFKFDPEETGKCMELMKVGHDQVLVVGTSQSCGPPIMPCGEAERTSGRLIVLCLDHVTNSDSGSTSFSSKSLSYSQRSSPFREIGKYSTEQFSGGSICSSPDDNSCDGIKLEESEAWHLRVTWSAPWGGMVLAICTYLDRYFLASAGNAFYVCSFPNDNSQRVRRLAVGRTRFVITTLTSYFTRIAVGDCRDGILFFSYLEEGKKLLQVHCDPSHRLVADCILLDVDTAVVTDRKGSITVLSRPEHAEGNIRLFFFVLCPIIVVIHFVYWLWDCHLSIKLRIAEFILPASCIFI
ncbi:OLC1v1038241C2 [Oldenlandia corymbosa var. corymbosa]|uniref:OLC1v1038241C2 n=1 Tax=Oldenlandia corymbosa var. corymbosa TaxID=529605 RepID=A0AAV1CZF3_OLDCO|nr:OLC1v1038241C2 [Oldenlandia corymbosa var. corymbosa]